VIVLAMAGTIVWSVLDRRRPSYPRLVAGARVYLRHYLAWIALVYGLSKVFKMQFPDPLVSTLDQRVGDISPMRLFWTFMGYSAPYTAFAGLCETAGCVLLLWRRTATLGAILIAIVMVNVVILNFSYDVPVKLSSSSYLIMALVIALPDLRRVLGAILGYAAPPVPERVRWSPRWERARVVAKVVFVGALAYGGIRQVTRGQRAAEVHALVGTWVVDEFRFDGVERTLATDPERWLRVSLNPQGIWLTPILRPRTWCALAVDETHHTLTLTPEDAKTSETWRYERPAPDRLVLDGVHAGHQLHVTLHLEPPGLLLTRGFHWINEEPFNR
jgi:uncharacterized membrane protein YphA (DoxX/SURF4 family)